MNVIDAPTSTDLNKGNVYKYRLEQVIPFALLVFIASLPFRQLLFIERNGFLILLGLLFTWSILNHRLWFVDTPFNKPFLVFVVWVGLTIPFSTVPSYSVKEFGKLLQSLLMFYAVVYFLRRPQHRDWLIRLLVSLVVIVSVAGILQFDPHNYQATRSFLSSEVWLTTFLVLFVPLLWALTIFAPDVRYRGLFATVGVLSTSCLLMTQSRAGLVALLVEAWIFGWLSRTRIVRAVVLSLTVLAMTGFVAAVYIDSTPREATLDGLRSTIPFRTTMLSVEHRFDIWSFMLMEIVQHPVVGIGFGTETLRLRYPSDDGSGEPGKLPVRNVGTHNIFLYMAVHVGVPGFLLFVWLVVILVKALLVQYWSSEYFPEKAVLLGAVTGVVGMLVRLQFDQMLVGTLAILFWVLVALATLHFPPNTRLSRATSHQSI